MSAQETKKIKRVNLTFHEGNTRRRVKYNQKDFDVLQINFTDNNITRLFEIPVAYLPDKDSIHLDYDPLTKSVSWSPKEIISHIVEI